MAKAKEENTKSSKIEKVVKDESIKETVISESKADSEEKTVKKTVKEEKFIEVLADALFEELNK